MYVEKKHSIQGIQYYLQFSHLLAILEKNPAWITGDYCMYRKPERIHNSRKKKVFNFK